MTTRLGWGVGGGTVLKHTDAAAVASHSARYFSLLAVVKLPPRRLKFLAVGHQFAPGSSRIGRPCPSLLFSAPNFPCESISIFSGDWE